MASKCTDTDYVCTLSDELIKKAEDELNEKPQWRKRDIQALREMILKKHDLKIRTDDAYLLRFLRAKKFDYDRAFSLIMKHFEMKADPKNEQLFANLRPSAVKHMLQAGVAGVLPHRDKLGRIVMVFRPGKWDPAKYTMDDIFRTMFMSLSKLVEDDMTQITGVVMIIDLDGLSLNHVTNISPFYANKISGLLQDEETQVSGVIMINDLNGIGLGHARHMSPFHARRITSLLQDEETQVSGIIMINDLNGIGLGHARHMSPYYARRISSLLQEEEAQINGIVLLADLKSLGWKQTRRFKPLYARRVIGLLQDCFPMRFKGMHYVNEPIIFDMIFAVMRPFMKQKILDRIHFHGAKFEELAEFIDVEHLPVEYGGKAPAFTNEEWMKTLLACDAEFDAEAKYGLIKSTGIQQPTTKDVALDCLAGSYRKLDI